MPGSWAEQKLELKHFFGVGLYERSVRVPADWDGSAAYLHVGAVNQRGRAFVNGEPVAVQPFGHLPFCGRCDGLLRPGEVNTIAVVVDMTMDPWALPPARLADGEGREGFQDSNPPVSYDFFPYGGIHRRVGLLALPPGHLTGERIESHAVGGGAFELTVRADADTTGLTEPRVEVLLDGERVAEGAPGEALAATIPGPRLWSPGEPELYRVGVRLLDGRTAVDEASTRTGFRTVAVEGDSLLVNGEPVFLRGVGKHEDFPAIGKAECLPLVVRDFDLLAWLGANSFRTSHYPYAEHWYDFADEAGVLVIGETSLVGLEERFYTRPDRLDAARSIVREMIDRDRHHPSVVAWSLANEPNVRSDAGAAFFAGLCDEAQAADAHRPVMYVAHGGPENNRGCGVYDLLGVNKYFGWYEALGTLGHTCDTLDAYLDAMHAHFGGPLMLAEFGADAVAGLHSMGDELFSEEFQADVVVAHAAVAESKPYVVGTHVWNFADFQTAQSPRRVTMNRKGLFTRDRTPKLAAHRLRARWNVGPADRPGGSSASGAAPHGEAGAP